jgi:MSHA biogenesis protein MshQ
MPRASHAARYFVRLVLLFAVLFAWHGAFAASQTRSPSSCTTQGGFGANWNNPGNAVSSNNFYATATVDGTTTDPLRCTGYGFTIPAGAVILGIQVNIERRSNRTSNGGSHDASVRLVKGGAAQGSNLATATTYTTTDVVEAHGGAAQLWGLAWLDTDINAANFGAEYTGTKPSPGGLAHTISVDYISVTVTYNQPPAQPSLLSPADTAVLATGTPAFDWTDSIDPDGDAVTYDIEADNGGCAFPSPELGQNLLATSSYTPVTALPDGTYCWHARAVDVFGLVGPWSTTRTFTISTVSGFNAVEQGAANGTTLKTKLAGVGFNLDVLALSGASISTAYTGTVAVEIVDASTGGGVCASMTQLQSSGSLNFVAADAGRKTIALGFANAVRDARIRMTDAAKGITSCSTDNFSLRPAAFSSVTSNMTNGGTSGAPVGAAGANFTLTAVALAGYDGTPKVDGTKLSAHAGAVQNGTLSGNFAAGNPVTGTATGNAFTYSEVGNFTLAANGIYDDGFTGVDQGAGDCTNDFSNVLVGGEYGCKFGNGAATAAIGRFKPDHFFLAPVSTLTNRSDLACAPASTFTYMTEPFQLSFVLRAQNTANGITQNYEGSIANLDLSTLAGLGLGARSGTTNLTSRLDTSIAPTGSFAAGEATITATVSLTRTTPDGPFPATAVGLAPSDADGTQLQAAALDMDVDASGSNDHQQVGASTEFRFGRLRMQNALGPEQAVLPIPVQTQYWNGTTFVTNAADNCTTLARANVTLGSYAQNLAACDTSANSANVPFAAGVGTLILSAAGAGNHGTVLLTPNLGATASGNYCPGSPGAESAATAAGRAYLQGAWSGGAWNQNPSAQAAFGLYGSQPKNFIFLRENY